jgi:hypothetical protein
MNERGRMLILCLVSNAAIAAVALHAPIPQPAGYSSVRGSTRVVDIENFCNVLSNCRFLIVGLIGIREIALRQGPPASSRA